MLARARTHLTYANVVSTVCLFILLGGSAYAATKVGSKQIVNNSIQSTDIKNNSVTGSDVKNRSLTGTDFKTGSLPSGPRGATGPAGAPGTPGAPGAPGSAAGSWLGGRSTYSTYFTNTYSSPLGNSSGNSSAAVVDMLSPARAIVARDLAIRDEAGPGLVFTLSVNGTDTSLSCTTGGSPVATCSNITDAVTIPPASRVALHVVDPDSSGGQPGTNPFRFGWRATTP